MAIGEGNWFIRNIMGYKTLLRVIFGIVWLVDAALKWMPSFFTGFESYIQASVAGQPAWLAPWFHLWISVTSHDPYVFALAVAIFETLIAVALLLGFARKITYYIGIIFSILLWSIPDAFGQFYLPGATDIGASIIYAIVFLFLILVNGAFGSSKYSLDHYLEKKIGWWARIAEISSNARTPCEPQVDG